MAEVASAFVSLVPSAKGFGRNTTSQLNGEVKKSGGALGGVFGKAFVAVGSALAVGSFLKGSLEEARESQKVGALTANVIKTTGGAAKITAAQVGNLSTAISNKVGVDDEAIQSGANLLLTFKNVKNEVGKGAKIFDRATAAAVDLSASGFGDINGASKQLGKALNDPVKGITALGRSGVTFSEDQKKAIKSFVASNDLLSAQKIILKEVESQVGGSAAAQATAADKAKVAYGNLKEQIGTALLPTIDAAANAFTTKLAPALSKAVNNIGPSINKAKAAISSFAKGSGGEGLTSVFKTASDTVRNVLVPTIIKLGKYLQAKLTPIFNQVIGIVKQLLPTLVALAQFFYGKVYPAIVKIAIAVGQQLKPVFEAIVQVLRTQILPTLSQVIAKFEEWRPTLQKVALVVLKVVGFVLKLAAAIIGRVLPILIRLSVFINVTLIKAIVKVIGWIVAFVGSFGKIGGAVSRALGAIGRFFAGVVAKGAAAVDYVKSLPGKILGAIGNLGRLLYNAGKDIVQGLIDGIQDKIGDLVGSLGKLTKLIPKKKGPASTDKRLLRPNGQLIMGGLIDGINDGVPKLAARLGGLTNSVPRMALSPTGGAGGAAGATSSLHGSTLTLVLEDGRQLSAYVDERVRANAGLNGEGFGV